LFAALGDLISQLEICLQLLLISQFGDLFATLPHSTRIIGESQFQAQMGSCQKKAINGLHLEHRNKSVVQILRVSSVLLLADLPRVQTHRALFSHVEKMTQLGSRPNSQGQVVDSAQDIIKSLSLKRIGSKES